MYSWVVVTDVEIQQPFVGLKGLTFYKITVSSEVIKLLEMSKMNTEGLSVCLLLFC